MTDNHDIMHAALLRIARGKVGSRFGLPREEARQIARIALIDCRLTWTDGQDRAKEKAEKWR